jgi:hypothetical protein
MFLVSWYILAALTFRLLTGKRFLFREFRQESILLFCKVQTEGIAGRSSGNKFQIETKVLDLQKDLIKLHAMKMFKARIYLSRTNSRYGSLLLSCFLVMAWHSMQSQAWQPIVSSRVSNFSYGRSFSSVLSIQVDTARLSGSDSVFSLNRVVQFVSASSNSELVCGNRPLFLGRKVIERNNGFATFLGDTSWTINCFSQPGDTWLSDSAHSYTATTISKSAGVVLGQPDSLKTIVFSNQDTLVLSCLSGIVSWRKGAAGHTYSLKGFQNLGLGYHVPVFADVFNFSLGDVLEYRDVYDHQDMRSIYTYTSIHHYKLTILTRMNYSDSIVYTATKLSSDTLDISSGNPGTVVIGKQNVRFSFINSTNQLANDYNGQGFASGTYCIYGGEQFNSAVFDTSTIFKTRMKRTYGTQYKLSGDYLNCYPQGYACYYSNSVGDGFGTIHSFNYVYSGIVDDELIDLVGSIKGGVTYGHVTPDALFSGIEDHMSTHIHLQPTLASDAITVIGLAYPITLNITDAMGRRVYSEVYASAPGSLSIDVKAFAPGIYFMSVLGTENHISTVLKFIRL